MQNMHSGQKKSECIIAATHIVGASLQVEGGVRGGVLHENHTVYVNGRTKGAY